MNRRSVLGGFTLIEAVVAIVITGILSAIAAVFMVGPIRSYVDAARRAELVSAADVAVRRMSRDVRLALPNSLRTVTNGFEFVLTKAAGRYRDSGDGSTGGSPLSFTSAASTDFDVLGLMPSLTTGASGDFIVVYNLGPGFEPANAYDCSATPPGCNIARVASFPAANTVRLASNVFGAQTPPLPSPSSRFQVVADADKVIRYTCTGGVLTRQAGCSLATPSVCPDAGVTLAGGGGISASCTIDLTTTALVRNAMLSVQLTLTDSVGGESVTLVEQLRVDNTP